MLRKFVSSSFERRCICLADTATPVTIDRTKRLLISDAPKNGASTESIVKRRIGSDNEYPGLVARTQVWSSGCFNLLGQEVADSCHL